MPLSRLNSEPLFPDPHLANPDGLLAVGGDLSPMRLLNAYANGIFPWYSDEDPLLWWSPPERAVFLPGDARITPRMRRAIRAAGFEIRVDTAFARVIEGCAAAPRGEGDGTWITPEMREAYVALHEFGFAHSFETWWNDELVGGLYGLSLGAAFFGESMFSAASHASRAAFAHLCEVAHAQGFHFIDGQLPNENLGRLGARVISRDDYLARLAQALEQPTRRGAWTRLVSGTIP